MGLASIFLCSRRLAVPFVSQSDGSLRVMQRTNRQLLSECSLRSNSLRAQEEEVSYFPTVNTDTLNKYSSHKMSPHNLKYWIFLFMPRQDIIQL